MKQRVIKKEKQSEFPEQYNWVFDTKRKQLEVLKLSKALLIASIATSTLISLFFGYRAAINVGDESLLIASIATGADAINILRLLKTNKKILKQIESNEKYEQIFLQYYGSEAKDINISDDDFNIEESKQNVYSLK